MTTAKIVSKTIPTLCDTKWCQSDEVVTLHNSGWCSAHLANAAASLPCRNLHPCPGPTPAFSTSSQVGRSSKALLHSWSQWGSLYPRAWAWDAEVLLHTWWEGWRVCQYHLVFCGWTALSWVPVGWTSGSHRNHITGRKEIPPYDSFALQPPWRPEPRVQNT